MDIFGELCYSESVVIMSSNPRRTSRKGDPHEKSNFPDSSAGPGAEAGLADNDIIIAVDDNEISDIYELQDVIFQLEVGDTVGVTVYRAGETKTFNVTLGELEEE